MQLYCRLHKARLYTTRKRAPRRARIGASRTSRTSGQGAQVRGDGGGQEDLLNYDGRAAGGVNRPRMPLPPRRTRHPELE